MDNPTTKTVDTIRFSFSGLSTFHTCRHAWMLTYLQETERTNNFFAEYGLLVHEVLEKYFRNELEAFELSNYFIDNYDRMVVSKPPFFIKSADYKVQGFEFFEKFDFDKDKYQVIVIEDKIDVDLDGYGVVVKPDLVIKDIATGKSYLVDYKTSIIEKAGKIDKKKLEGYKTQMTMYAKYLETKDIVIDEVWIWFIRQAENKFYKFKATKKDKSSVEKWIESTVVDIRQEKDFPPTVNAFFCKNLCSVSSYCVHKPD